MTFLLLAACAPIAACGGGSDGGNGTTGTTNGTATPVQTPGHATIVMQDTSFVAPLTIVTLGTEITWVNNDDVQHDVESTSGEKIDSPLFGKGGTFSFTPTKEGAIEYVCTVHPGMKARIQVEPKRGG